MKRIKAYLTLSAFVLSVFATIATLANKQKNTEVVVYGYSNELSRCMSSPTTLDLVCGESGSYQCSVHLAETDEVVPAFSASLTDLTCAVPIRKW